VIFCRHPVHDYHVGVVGGGSSPGSALTCYNFFFSSNTVKMKLIVVVKLP